MDSFRSRSVVRTAGGDRTWFRLGAVEGSGRLPFAHQVMLENLLRHEDGETVTADDVLALVEGSRTHEIAFHPARAFLHDTNGVPVLTDLAAMRDAVRARGEDPALVDAVIPADLTADHSISTDFFGRPDAPALNVRREYERNSERYRFLKWGTQGFDALRVVPPGAGIMHQVNVEHLATVVTDRDGMLFPDTVAGTDSHTTMVNGLSVLAWGVGGIEVEAAMLGQPISLVIPPVVGVELTGSLDPGVTATDLVLTLTERLRAHGVVGKIVEFFGPGIATTGIAVRSTLANMSPEFGSTAAMFPIDAHTVDYLRLTGRSPAHAELVERYARAQGLWHDPAKVPDFDETITLDLGSVRASLSGPRRPQDRLDLPETRVVVQREIGGEGGEPDRTRFHDGAVAIASITSCTNTSNPDVMVAAALLARNAVEAGLVVPSWVKTSLAPGSRVVVEYLDRAGLMPAMEKLGFGLVGYGCMTCIGNSGELVPEAAAAVHDDGMAAAAVLSGNRNFDGRVNNDVRLNFLASPPLVVAFALAGTTMTDLTRDPIGSGHGGRAVHLRDLWPSDEEIAAVVADALDPELFRQGYAGLFDGDASWRGLDAPRGETFAWDPDSTYLQAPPFLDVPEQGGPITGARVLQVLGDSVTTDHICPAGRIPSESGAGRYLREQGVEARDLNTYASRRGAWRVMRLGGFTNPRLVNRMTPDLPGGSAVDLGLDGRDSYVGPVAAVADRHLERGTPLIVLAGREYGTGSSRDWAAKVTRLLGVRAVIAGSFERIHRSNLVGIGVLPLELAAGDTIESLGLTGHEEFDLPLVTGQDVPERLEVTARHLTTGVVTRFVVRARIDTRREQAYYRSGGLLPHVLNRIIPTGGTP